MSYLAIGADVSVNHSAIVVLDQDGKVRLVRYLCQKVKDAKKRLGGTRCIAKRVKHITKEQFEIERLMWLRDYYDDITGDVIQFCMDDDIEAAYVGLEAYAYAAGRGAKGAGMVFKSRPYQIGEASAVFRIACKDLNFWLRLHDPASVKIFACNIGNAPKEDVQAACYDAAIMGGLDMDAYPDDEDVQGDLGDAFMLATMVRTEAEVRAGRKTLKQLDEGQRRVFLRTTKTNPVNLLDKPWL